MSTSTEPSVTCAACDREIEGCACCQNPECQQPICRRDLLFLTRESIPQPHTHGG